LPPYPPAARGGKEYYPAPRQDPATTVEEAYPQRSLHQKTIDYHSFDGQGLIYGIGHAVYTLSDPRAVLLKDKAKELAAEKDRSQEFDLYERVARLTPEVFAQVKNSTKVISTNVDFYSGFVYDMLDIPRELYTPIFCIARIAGWCAHRLEELISGGRIIRPAYRNALRNKDYVPMQQR
jgi:citrate synthase